MFWTKIDNARLGHQYAEACTLFADRDVLDQSISNILDKDRLR